MKRLNNNNKTKQILTKACKYTSSVSNNEMLGKVNEKHKTKSNKITYKYNNNKIFFLFPHSEGVPASAKKNERRLTPTVRVTFLKTN